MPMLRIITCICLCFLGGSIAQAQRLLPKQKGISLSWVAPAEAFTSSFSDDFGVQLGYSINAKRGNYKHFALEYQKVEYKSHAPVRNKEIILVIVFDLK